MTRKVKNSSQDFLPKNTAKPNVDKDSVLRLSLAKLNDSHGMSDLQKVDSEYFHTSNSSILEAFDRAHSGEFPSEPTEHYPTAGTALASNAIDHDLPAVSNDEIFSRFAAASRRRGRGPDF